MGCCPDKPGLQILETVLNTDLRLLHSDPKFQGAQLPSQPSLGMFHFLFAGVFDFVMMGKIHPDSVDSV